MSSITNFKNAIRSGLVRQHKWRVTIDFPVFAATNDVARQAQLLARTTSTPSSTLGTMELAWGGRILPLPGDRVYEEFPVTFIGVNDFKVKDALETWSEYINGSESNTGLVNPEDYMKDIVLELLDAQDNVTKTYILKDAYPLSVGSMDLDAGAQDSYAEFPVSFRYINYESNTTR